MKHIIIIDGYIGPVQDFFGDSKCFCLIDLQTSIDAMPAGVTELTVQINSGGGLSTEGFGIHDLLASLDIPVSTEILGLCGSIATIISQAPKTQGKGGKRLMHKNSEFFVHNGAWVPSAPVPHNAQELDEISQELKKLDTKLIDFYATVTGAEKEWIATKMENETTLSSKEAKEHGFIDEVVGAEIMAYTKYRLVAITSITKPNTDTMTTLKKEISDRFSKLENMFAAAFGKKVAVKVTSAEGTDIHYDGELKEGTKIFTDEAMTIAAPNGPYTVEAKIYTVTDGVVTKVEDVVVNDKDKEIENLKAHIAAKETELTAAKNEKETVVTAAKEIEKEFVALQNKIVTGGKEIFDITVDRNDPPQAKENLRDAQIRLKKEAEEKAKKK